MYSLLGLLVSTKQCNLRRLLLWSRWRMHVRAHLTFVITLLHTKAVTYALLFLYLDLCLVWQKGWIPGICICSFQTFIWYIFKVGRIKLLKWCLTHFTVFPNISCKAKHLGFTKGISIFYNKLFFCFVLFYCSQMLRNNSSFFVCFRVKRLTYHTETASWRGS